MVWKFFRWISLVIWNVDKKQNFLPYIWNSTVSLEPLVISLVILSAKVLSFHPLFWLVQIQLGLFYYWPPSVQILFVSFLPLLCKETKTSINHRQVLTHEPCHKKTCFIMWSHQMLFLWFGFTALSRVPHGNLALRILRPCFPHVGGSLLTCSLSKAKTHSTINPSDLGSEL